MQPDCVYYICSMSEGQYRRGWDNAGMTASILCAIHCAIVPILITVLPLAGLGFLANPFVEWSMIAFALAIGSYAIGLSYFRVHHKMMPAVFLLAGFLVIIGGHIFTRGWHEAIVVPIGGLLIAAAHFVNYRFSVVSNVAKLPIWLKHEHDHGHKSEVTTEQI